MVSCLEINPLLWMPPYTYSKVSFADLKVWVMFAVDHIFMATIYINYSIFVQTFEYRWGERANLEVKKSFILTSACKMYKCNPAAFAHQFDQVCRCNKIWIGAVDRSIPNLSEESS